MSKPEAMRSIPVYEGLSHTDFVKQFPTAGTAQPKPIPLILPEEERHALDEGWESYYASYVLMKECSRALYLAGQTYDATKAGRGQALSAEDQHRQHRSVQDLEIEYGECRKARDIAWGDLKEAILAVGSDFALKHYTERRQAINKRLGECRLEAVRVWRKLDPLERVLESDLATPEQKQQARELQIKTESLADEAEKIESASGPLSEAERCCAEGKLHKDAEAFAIRVKI